MSANTQGHAGVGTGETAREVGAVLSGMVVARRRVDTVGGALNGNPRPCSDARARHVRSEAQREGGSSHYEGSVALDFCDIADGVPVELVNAWHVRAMAANVAHAEALKGPTPPRPLKLASHLETVKQGPLDVAQVDLDPDDPASVERLITRLYGYLPAANALLASAEAQLAVVRATPRPVYGARRGTMQVMR